MDICVLGFLAEYMQQMKLLYCDGACCLDSAKSSENQHLLLIF